MTEAPRIPHSAKSSMNYRQAGVDIQAGDTLIEAIKPVASSTHRPGVIGNLGGFGALFDLNAAGYKNPVLVSCTDGVGTKLLVAIETGIHHSIGIDLVAMCVNDLVVQGAEPLFFLDYFATGKLDVDNARHIIDSIAQGCILAHCALIGGETAEMPGMYARHHYDLAGFAVGAVEHDKLLPTNLKDGDVVLGLASSGIHANGFSLVRAIVERSHLSWFEPSPFSENESLAQALLTPTRLYTKPLLSLHQAGLLKAAAHITGGGLPGNLPRLLPQNLGIRLDGRSWPISPVFYWLAKAGNISSSEMVNVFNCGIGMAIIVSDVEAARVVLNREKEAAFPIGYIETRGNRETSFSFNRLPDFGNSI